MAPDHDALRPQRPRPDLLAEYGRERPRGGALRSWLAARFPDRPADEVEDAVQSACASFLAEGAGISDPGAVYAWLRTAAHRSLLRELTVRRRADPADGTISALVSERPGPAEELIELEDDVDLDVLVGDVATSLPAARRDVLALWAEGLSRSEIASRLGASERIVKRSLEAIMAEARTVLARKAGGGCDAGEALVMRSACGLAAPEDSARAHDHLSECLRCSVFAERLEAWREKAGAMLPAPAALEAGDPGYVSRTLERAGHSVGSLKRQVLGERADAPRQASALYGKAVDPTPLAAVRPGAVVAVVAGCIAIGGGATYCAQSGLDPIGAADRLLAGGGEPRETSRSKPEYAPEEPVSPPSVDTPQEAPVYKAETKPEPTEASPQASESEPHKEAKTEPKPEPQAEPVEVTPPPEQSFEPASPEYPSTETASSPSQSSTGSEGDPARPAPVPAHESPQFGGP